MGAGLLFSVLPLVGLAIVIVCIIFVILFLAHVGLVMIISYILHKKNMRKVMYVWISLHAGWFILSVASGYPIGYPEAIIYTINYYDVPQVKKQLAFIYMKIRDE